MGDPPKTVGLVFLSFFHSFCEQQTEESTLAALHRYATSLANVSGQWNVILPSLLPGRVNSRMMASPEEIVSIRDDLVHWFHYDRNELCSSLPSEWQCVSDWVHCWYRDCPRHSSSKDGSGFLPTRVWDPSMTAQDVLSLVREVSGTEELLKPRGWFGHVLRQDEYTGKDGVVYIVQAVLDVLWSNVDGSDTLSVCCWQLTRDDQWSLLGITSCTRVRLPFDEVFPEGR
jgi:hypothetical protein